MPYAFDPELVPFLDALPVPAGTDDFTAARAFLDQYVQQALAMADESGLTITDEVVAADPDVPVRRYVPQEKASDAGVLYIHGGGFTVGSIDMEHAQACAVAREVGVEVVSVEYRLAPEHPFPAAIDDCYAALEWFAPQVERVAVVGSSAGGALAAGLALLARDRGGPALCFQYLGIPGLDHRLETWSMRTFVDTPMWSRPQAERSLTAYLGEDRSDVSPYASPAIAADLTGLPPAYISTMEFDPLRDEGIEYAVRLMRAGVSVELHSFPGTFHGSSAFPAAVTAREIAEMMTVLRQALAPR